MKYFYDRRKLLFYKILVITFFIIIGCYVSKMGSNIINIKYDYLPLSVSMTFDSIMSNNASETIPYTRSTAIKNEAETNKTADIHKNTIICPINNKSIIISVKPGGRLGNLVFEYLSVYAWSKDILNSIAVVPNNMLTNLNKVFINLSLESIESLDLKCCNKYELLHNYNKIMPSGNWELFEKLDSESRDCPTLLVLPQYAMNVDLIWKYWNNLYREMKMLPLLINTSNEKLNNIRTSLSIKLELKENEIIEFVGVHVRKRDYFLFIIFQYPGAKCAKETYYFKAMEKMREILKPKRPIFVVVSDDMEWCKKHFQNIPDVVLSEATGNIENPSEDIALLCSCNHTIMSYGTFGLASTICHPKGHVIVYKDENLISAPISFAKYLNWTMISN